jgi:hypothetical protein
MIGLINKTPIDVNNICILNANFFSGLPNDENHTDYRASINPMKTCTRTHPAEICLSAHEASTNSLSFYWVKEERVYAPHTAQNVLCPV